MKKVAYIRWCFAFLLLSLLPVSCVPVAPAAKKGQAEALVDARLREAGEAITRDLAQLTGSSQHRDMANPVGSGDLQTKMSLDWHGPIEGALAYVAAHIGYKFIVSGQRPATPLFVHVKLLDRPVISVLREIGLQTGKSEGVNVDAPSRSISLIYGEEQAK